MKKMEMSEVTKRAEKLADDKCIRCILEFKMTEAFAVIVFH